MILPIVAYGAPILRKPAASIDAGYPQLRELISDMWDTMYHASGCGLAASQVNKPVTLFIIDSTNTYESMSDEARPTYFDSDTGVKEVFINPHILSVSTEQYWEDEEGCLSIPGVSGIVSRPWQITISYLNEAFQERLAKFSGMTARMIQHEYDHLQGKLYLDYLSPLKRRLMQGRLDNIARGKSAANYPVQYPKKR
jgi:peptide deformylase